MRSQQGRSKDQKAGAELDADIQYLFNRQGASSELARRSNINEVTFASIRDGKATRRHAANRLLLELSKVYDRMLTLRNVTGIKVQGIKREGQKKEEKWLRSPGYGVLSLRNHVTPQP